jgi:KDO2-lipid IV(A) lauroyltransferase
VTAVAARERWLRRARHGFEYAALRALVDGLARWPEPAAEAVAAALGRAMHSVFRVRRGIVHAQIAAAYPDAPRAWVRRVARASYVHFAREMVATAAFARTWPDGLRARVEVVRLDDLRAAARAGGAVIVTGHFGNWELSASAVAAHGVPMYAVYQAQANPRVDAYVRRMRAALGLRLVRRGEVGPAARAILREGGVLGFVADQHARLRGLWVPFFGRPASTHRGPAHLALRFGVPLFVGAMRRTGPGRRYRLEIEEVPTADLRGARRGGPAASEPVAALTGRWVACLERMVRAAPEQYLWLHRRWKGRPAGTPGPEAGRTGDPRTAAREEVGGG